MISDPVVAKHYHSAQRALRTYRDKNRARNRILEDGVPEIDADRVIEFVFNDNTRANRKLGLYYFVGAGAVAVIICFIWTLTDRLFYIALPISGIATILGLFQLFFPSGYYVMLPTEPRPD